MNMKAQSFLYENLCDYKQTARIVMNCQKVSERSWGDWGVDACIELLQDSLPSSDKQLK